MDNDMSDVINKLKNALDGKQASDLSSLFSSINQKDTNNSNSSSSGSDFNIDPSTILKMQEIMKAMNSNQSNSRSNLLRSLKPYLKPSRQEKVDQYIQLFNMEKVFEMLNNTGGGKK